MIHLACYPFAHSIPLPPLPLNRSRPNGQNMEEPNRGPRCHVNNGEAVHPEKHTPKVSAAPSPAPSAPLCLLCDILSEGLNNKTASQLLWVMNSTGFEQDLEEENENTHSFEPFQRKHHPLATEWKGVDIKRTPWSCVSQLFKLPHSQGYVHGCKWG